MVGLACSRAWSVSAKKSRWAATLMSTIESAQVNDRTTEDYLPLKLNIRG